MNSIELLKKFGFKVEHKMKSIYPFAPVYKVDNYIVKKTQSPYVLAINLVKYVEYLSKQQVPRGNKLLENSCKACFSR